MQQLQSGFFVGDATRDGDITIKHAPHIQKQLAGLKDFIAVQLYLADIGRADTTVGQRMSPADIGCSSDGLSLYGDFPAGFIQVWLKRDVY